MGILSDFVIADAGMGRQIAESFDQDQQWPTLQARGVDHLKLAALYCAISGVEYNDEVVDAFEMVYDDEGQWVFVFPPQVLQSIAAVTHDAIPRLAEEWAGSEGLAMDGWDEEGAAAFIEAIAGHARKAVQDGKTLYLWLSL